MRIIIAIAVFSQWSGNGLISYYSHIIFESVGITDPRTQAALNGGLGVWNLFWAMLGAMMVDKLGRRTIFLISNIGMLVMFCFWTVTVALFSTFKYTAAAKATIPSIFLFYAFYDIAYTPLLIAYGLEILPYTLRAKGFTVLVSHDLPRLLRTLWLTSSTESYHCSHYCLQSIRQSLGP
jgi:hypothetical protein